LAAFLPQYMVPAAFMVLDALPLTSNGKLDRKALPAPNEAGLATCGAYMAPRNPFEVEMAAIWAEVFQPTQVGIHDNFFDLGGHSLMALRLFSLIQERFKRNLPLASLFLRPTIAQLTELVVPPRDPDPTELPSRLMRAPWVRLAKSVTALLSKFN